MPTTEQYRAAQRRGVEARKATGTNNSGSRLAYHLINGGCTARQKWEGFDCREAWPVSRMIWCDSCRSFFVSSATARSAQRKGAAA